MPKRTISHENWYWTFFEDEIIKLHWYWNWKKKLKKLPKHRKARMPVNLTSLWGVDLLSMSTQGCLTRCRKTVGGRYCAAVQTQSRSRCFFFFWTCCQTCLCCDYQLRYQHSATRSLIDQLFSNLPLNIIDHPQRVSFNTSLPIQLDVTSVEWRPIRPVW